MAQSIIRITEPCQTKRDLLSRSSATVLRFSRPETNEEVFEFFAADHTVIELFMTARRLMPSLTATEVGHAR